ncbi:alpha/beta fold hydrolase [Amnibacterium kyonggiense]|uniref:Alpha/beta hydrolase family protein n=1 Tax=Amnibacterium kyonggiense TaxID=595671 RepID=A0A4R7FFY3_9MICO|nr:alpha/beta hydrolase [Amnibacterium kyonggiense]TDS75800.1 alpha/beta hydrolase family protein [Amnibacterium kyonggiense]
MAGLTTTLPSGSQVGVSAFGDPMADRLVIICHPTPGASGFDPDPVLTERWGLRLVGLDRPGYGSTPPSTPNDGTSLTARADDVAAFVEADERNADRISNADLEHCGVIGWGAGAVVAAALAARHPGLVDRLVLVSPLDPRAAQSAAGRTVSRADGASVLGVAEDDTAFDRHLGLDRRLARMLDAAFQQGDAGLVGDRRLFTDTGWVEHLADIDADCLVVVGAEDSTADGSVEWWRRHLPVATRVEEVEGGGLAIVDAWETILGHVAPAHGHIVERERDHGAPRLPDLPPRS